MNNWGTLSDRAASHSVGFLHTLGLFFQLYFSNWRIIALQNFVVSVIHQQRMSYILYRGMSIDPATGTPVSPPSSTSPWTSPHLPPHLTLLDCHRAPVWVLWVMHQIPVGCLLYIWQCKFPCYSLHTSHPLPSPLPLCPQVCSLCLFLQKQKINCPEKKFISTIFPDSVYMHQYTMFILLFLTSLCVIGAVELLIQWLCPSFQGRGAFRKRLSAGRVDDK